MNEGEGGESRREEEEREMGGRGEKMHSKNQQKREGGVHIRERATRTANQKERDGEDIVFSSSSSSSSSRRRPCCVVCAVSHGGRGAKRHTMGTGAKDERRERERGGVVCVWKGCGACRSKTKQRIRGVLFVVFVGWEREMRRAKKGACGAAPQQTTPPHCKRRCACGQTAHTRRGARGGRHKGGGGGSVRNTHCGAERQRRRAATARIRLVDETEEKREKGEGGVVQRTPLGEGGDSTTKGAKDGGARRESEGERGVNRPSLPSAARARAAALQQPFSQKTRGKKNRGKSEGTVAVREEEGGFIAARDCSNRQHATRACRRGEARRGHAEQMRHREKGTAACTQ